MSETRTMKSDCDIKLERLPEEDGVPIVNITLKDKKPVEELRKQLKKTTVPKTNRPKEIIKLAMAALKCAEEICEDLEESDSCSSYSDSSDSYDSCKESSCNCSSSHESGSDSSSDSETSTSDEQSSQLSTAESSRTFSISSSDGDTEEDDDPENDYVL